MVAGVLHVAWVALHDRAHLDVEAAQDTSVLGVTPAEDPKREDVFNAKDIRDVVCKAAECLFFIPTDLGRKAQWVERNELVGVVVDNCGKLVIGVVKVVDMLLGIEGPIHSGLGRVDVQIGYKQLTTRSFEYG